MERATEERRKAVEELITARSTIERLQRDLTAAQQELKSVSGELRDERSATDKHLVQARQVDEALKQLLPIDSAGEGTSALDKVAVVGQLLRKAKSDLQAEQSKRHAADHLVLEQRTEAEERLRREAEAALQERKALQAEFEQQLHALRQQVKNLDSQLGAAQAKAMEQSEAARAALEMKAADESAIAEHAAVEELLSEAQARIAALESKEALHEDEVRSARESQQKAQWALANQLAAAEAALLQERATMLRLTTERDKGWADATARKRTELPVALIPEELKGQSKEALFAQLQEVFFAEAQARLLGQ